MQASELPSSTAEASQYKQPIEWRHSAVTIPSAIDSTAKGELVARRRFQKDSVYKNKAGTAWLGMYSQYVLDASGIERRKRRFVVLGPVHKPGGEEMREREAQRLLQPYLDRVNSSISAPAREHKSATLEASLIFGSGTTGLCLNRLHRPRCVAM